MSDSKLRVARVLIVASGLLIGPYFAMQAGAVSLDDILKMKERFQQIKAVKYTNEFKEHFDRVMEPFDSFSELSSKMVDAQTGRDPWKIEERPSWTDDPLGRLIKIQAEGYENVADSIMKFEMPANLFDLETSLGAYPSFWPDWERCDPKAAEALTNDLGKIEIALSALSDAQEKFRAKAKEAQDVRAVWDDIVRYIDRGMALPRLTEFDHVSYLFAKGQAIQHTIFGGTGNKSLSSSDRGLTRVEKALAIKSNEMAEKERTLRSVRASLTSGLSRYQARCIDRIDRSVARQDPATPRSGSDISGLDQLTLPSVPTVPGPSVSSAPPRINAPSRPTSGAQGVPVTNVPHGRSNNTPSDITGTEQAIAKARQSPGAAAQRPDGGLNASYEPITKPAAQALMAKYKSIPGGVTLEGDSPDFAFVTRVRFIPATNAFILNDEVTYLNPISADEFSQINDALAGDDKLGVSLGTEGIVYGALTPKGTVAWKLKVADKFLGAISYNKRMDVEGYQMAPGYEVALDGVHNGSVYFNFHDVRFAQDPNGELRRSAIKIAATAVPLAPANEGSAVRQPDFDAIARGKIQPRAVARLQHLVSHFDYYGRERIIRQAVAYAEAAAFIRSMKARGIKLDLK